MHDKTDVFLLFVGTIGALIYGAIVPGQFILMGEATESLVEFVHCLHMNCTSRVDVEGAVATVAYWYVGVAIVNCIMAWMCFGLWGVSAERQVHKMRVALFKNIVNQEMAWFDQNPSGELNSRLSE